MIKYEVYWKCRAEADPPLAQKNQGLGELPNPLLWFLSFKPRNALVRTQPIFYIMILYINNLYNSKSTMDFWIIIFKLLIYNYFIAETSTTKTVCRKF